VCLLTVLYRSILSVQLDAAVLGLKLHLSSNFYERSSSPSSLRSARVHGAIEPSAPQRWQTAYRRGPRSRPFMARFRSAVRTSCGGRSNKRARSEEEPVELQRFISDPYPFAITVKLGATKQGDIVYAAQPSEDLVCGICLRNVMVGPTHLSSCQSGHSTSSAFWSAHCDPS
jgi:hypothetical protein